MERAPWPVGLVFGLSLVLVVGLVGPLLLFNPAFTTMLQERHGVARAFGTTQPEIERVTASFLADIYLDGDFAASLDGDQPLLEDDERSHMRDVSRLVRLLAGVGVMGLILAGVAGAWLRREPRRQGRIMLIVGGGIGTAAILVALAFAVAFDAAFTAFHELFFPPGTWQFAPGSALITLFPEGFWFDAALAAGATIVVAALAVTLVGLARWRGARRASGAGLP